MLKKPAQKSITKTKNPFKRKTTNEPTITAAQAFCNSMKEEAPKTIAITIIQFGVTAGMAALFSIASDAINDAMARKKDAKFQPPTGQ